MSISSASKNYAYNGPHTAGLLADMSLDGPVIGTLVAIIDRAKNLPNRKTIGKQDPYCAARLGKEAKKTTTDIRGGQTPKWDQELRFSVHDSTDYYQLKISIFTDDKKTDLIGESWIDLKNIIISGGGQSDMWQTLACRGKYAGEIRLEITFYDTRPKLDRPAPRPKQITSGEQETSPPKRKELVKRRPLPSDPVTGETTANVPLPTPPSDLHHQTPPRSLGKQHSHSLSPYGSSQSLHQPVEYSTPPPPHVSRSQPSDHYSPSPSNPGSGRVEGPRQPRSSTRDLHDISPRPYEERERDRGYSQKMITSPYDQSDPRSSGLSLASEPYETASREELIRYHSHEDFEEAAPPPPPPVHRSRHSSSQEALQSRSLEISPQKAILPPSMRSDVLKNEAHRSSTSNYPGRPQFKPYDPSVAVSRPAPRAITYEPLEPAHHSQDSYDNHYRSMQPTVEDVPESPTGSLRNRGRQSSARLPLQDEMRHESAPIPTSTSLSRSPGASAGYMSRSPGHYQTYPDQVGNPASVSPLSARDFTGSPGQVSHPSHSSHSQRSNMPVDHETTYIQSSSSYALPALPPSLAPGVDPNVADEMSNRMYEERYRDNTYNNQLVHMPRDRHMSEPPQSSYDSTYGTSPQGYPSYDRRRSGTAVYSGGPEPSMSDRRDISPNPSQHKIHRKSVSPAPPIENRRHSDIPFGPDSYDAFNPGMSSRDGTPGLDEPDPDAKIVTHDGREIDPSDHLPIESWAPEPEKKPQAPPETRSRPPLSGAQPMPPSGRRPLRVSMNRTSQALVAPGHAHSYSDDHRTPPVASGRQRLQKKQRASIGPMPSGSGPLAPISPDNFQDRSGQYTPTRSTRAGTWDYPNENYAPQYHGGAHGPPIPAKVPLPLMSGANGGVDDMALMQEMQKIDIGTGRSRRRGGY